jgi:hypothetical protein
MFDEENDGKVLPSIKDYIGCAIRVNKTYDSPK